MLARITAEAYLDFLQQLTMLMSDPVCYGTGVPRGTGQPVLLIPGFTAGDWSLGTLARWLKRVGYRPYLSGIDLNVGCPQRKVELVGWRVAKIVRETGMPVVIIGHSLGGVLARAILANSPHRVRHVIALGSPVRNPDIALQPGMRPVLQAVQTFWQTVLRSPSNCGTEACECGVAAAAMGTMPAGSFTAIYTRRDEIVNWRNCIDDAGPSHEVPGLHSSLIVNPRVFRLLGVILAELSDTQMAPVWENRN